MKEKRKAKRIYCSNVVEYLHENKKRFVNCVDCSFEGLSFNSWYSVQVNCELLMYFYIRKNNYVDKILMKGKVVYCQKLKNRYRIGMQIKVLEGINKYYDYVSSRYKNCLDSNYF